jgi:hypothetical protein
VNEPPPSQEPSRTGQYFEGIGIGLIPLALLFLGLRNSALGSVPIWLYLVEVIAAIVALSYRRVRFVGYGLLTMVILSPPIAFQISCMVSAQGHI